MHKNYSKNNIKNKVYKIFLKYELRHTIQEFIKNSDFKSLKFLLSELDNKVLKLFSPIEIKFYNTNSIKSLQLFYIKITKLRWRLRGYPRIYWSKPANKKEMLMYE